MSQGKLAVSITLLVYACEHFGNDTILIIIILLLLACVFLIVCIAASFGKIQLGWVYSNIRTEYIIK